MRTFNAKPAEALAAREWWVVDAEGQPLGRVASKVATILRGKPHDRATPAAGYRSANVTTLVLRATEGFALDGQIFAPAAGADVQVVATPPREFLSLARA